MPLQQLAEESFGGFLITARLDEDIDYITILVYRAPEVLAFTLYLYEDLVQVPCVTETTLPTLQSPSVFRPELNAPQSDRFVRNRDASLSEQLFDVSKAHAESLSRPGESHPQPLAERYVNLSTHTAPIRRTHLSSRGASEQTDQGDAYTRSARVGFNKTVSLHHLLLRYVK